MQSKESIHTKEHHTDRETVNLKNRERNKQSKYNVRKLSQVLFKLN